MNFWVSAIALPVAVTVTLVVLLYPSLHSKGIETEPMPVAVMVEPMVEPFSQKVQTYLESKDSPLASDAEFLIELEHWKLLVAISAIESQYCIRQLGNNCWGVGGDTSYRTYSSFRAAAVDANDLISDWQTKGRWLTVEDMNCHYVVPCNPNWVHTVNKVLSELNALERPATTTAREDAE